jgi:ribosomal protein L32E
MAETTTPTKRRKPLFLRRDWYKKIKFGKGVKKNQKWRGAKGRQNKTRLGRKGYGKRPKIGYGSSSAIRDKVESVDFVRIENTKQLENLKSGQGILIANIGKKKKTEVIAKANEMKLIILNKYRKTPTGVPQKLE